MSSSIAKIKIIEEKKEWQDFLDEIGYYDFYHTFDYHHLSKGENEHPVLIGYKQDDISIGLPLLIRKIFDTDYYDITSVYGYAGPLQKNVNNKFDNQLFVDFLQKYFVQKNIVTAFSRLNPFIDYQVHILNGLGEINPLSQVVNIDLTKNLENQRTLFSKTTKRYINKARKLCKVKKGSTAEGIKAFMELYYENMDRVHAKKSYYFNEQYFHDLINSNDFETEILYALYQETNEIISAAMMIKTNDIIQYHISGTRNDYLYLTPIRLLIDEMRIIGTKNNFRYFNLGGGVGGAEDSLFRFKSSFSKDFKQFNIWKCIVNTEVYERLSQQFSDPNGNKNFFPLYRNL